MRAGRERRGRPVLALSGLMTAWVLMRVVIGVEGDAGMASPAGEDVARTIMAASRPADPREGPASDADSRPAGAAAGGDQGRAPALAPLPARPATPAPPVTAQPRPDPAPMPIPVASGHLLIWLDTVSPDGPSGAGAEGLAGSAPAEPSAAAGVLPVDREKGSATP